jgi:hypothetical protein
MTYKYNFYRKTRSASLGHARHELSESGAAIGRNRWQPLVFAAMLKGERKTAYLINIQILFDVPGPGGFF